jgi:predicted porin
MKKTLLAAALLAGFAGAASAQSSVTLYGIVDVGVASQTIKAGDNVAGNPSRNNTSVASGQQSGSRWGLKGVEDLGNGLSANFVYEQGINVGNGVADAGFQRQATLGLVSKSWGGLDIGRRVTPGTNAFSGIDPFGTGFGTSSVTSSMGMAFARYSNALFYTTPNINGFVGGIAYSFDTGANNNNAAGTNNGERITGAPDYALGVDNFGTTYKTRAFGLGLRYGSGPLVVAGTLDIAMPASYNNKNFATFSSSSGPSLSNKRQQNASNVTQWNLGATYDFKVVKAHVAYGQNIGGILKGGSTINSVSSGGDSNANGGFLFRPGARTSSWMVGLTAPVSTSGSVFLSWQQMAAGGNFKSTQYSAATQNTGSIGYTYNLSKRTNLYAYYSYMSNVAMFTGSQSNTLGVGVRHLF